MSFSINRATLLGNLSRDPELRHTQSGKSVLTINLVTNHSIKNDDGTYKDIPTFHRVIIWGKIAEWLSKNLKKGSKCFAEGRIHTNEYTDKEGKVQRSREIIADNVIPMTTQQAAEAIKNDAVVTKEATIDDIPDNEATQANKEAEGAKNQQMNENVNPSDIPF